jgi:hypothetical protein
MKKVIDRQNSRRYFFRIKYTIGGYSKNKFLPVEDVEYTRE